MSFGIYGQSINETNPKNTTTLRKLGVIYLRELETSQGGFEVMNLLTGKTISRCKVNMIPIVQEVIDIVEDLTKNYGIKYPLKFKCRKEETICKDDDENDDDDGSIAGVDDEDEE